MTANAYLHFKGSNDQITFIIAHAVKEENTPFYRTEYRTTPIRTAYDWLDGGWGKDYIVTNANHPPIDVTGVWQREYKSGRLSCAMLTTAADLIAVYGEKQGADMVKHYESKVENDIIEKSTK